MTAREAIQKLLDEGITDRDAVVRKVVEETGFSRGRVLDVFNNVERRKILDSHKGGISRAQLRDKFDLNTRIRNAIKRGLATLVEAEDPEDDPILDEGQFRSERCGDMNVTGFRRIAEEPEFLAHQFRVGEKIFWTTPRTKQWALENVSRARDV